MATHISVMGYFLHAGFVVKSVMFILMIGSVASWTFIIERARFYRVKQRSAAAFLNRFWRSGDLSRLYADMDVDGEEKEGIAALFYEGFKEYWRRKTQGVIALEPIQRVMQIVYVKESVLLEEHLPFFASVGSIAPYIGLFGTVWGIMTSFQALGQAQQATIAMVAPGISEALVATALGLFTAIPAVMAYNRFSSMVSQHLEQYELFQQEFIALIEQQGQAQVKGPDRVETKVRPKQAKPQMSEMLEIEE